MVQRNSVIVLNSNATNNNDDDDDENVNHKANEDGGKKNIHKKMAPRNRGQFSRKMLLRKKLKIINLFGRKFSRKM